MTITRGDSPSWSIPLYNEDGGPLDLALASASVPLIVTVTCKARVTDDDVDALFQHYIKIENGIVTESAGMEVGTGGMEDGIIIERLDPAISSTFLPGSYKWDLEVRVGDDVHTLINNRSETVVVDYTIDAPA